MCRGKSLGYEARIYQSDIHTKIREEQSPGAYNDY